MFLDRNLGKKTIAEALRHAGADVRVHDDHFSPNARDEEWLSEVGRRQWVVLTKDERIIQRLATKHPPPFITKITVFPTLVGMNRP